MSINNDEIVVKSESADLVFEGKGESEKAGTGTQQANAIVFCTGLVEILQVSLVCLLQNQRLQSLQKTLLLLLGPSWGRFGHLTLSQWANLAFFLPFLLE
jgi:hypothetical protein